MEGQDPTDDEFLELCKIQKAMEKLNARILKMGYWVYLACDKAHIMKGDTHTGGSVPTSITENSVFSFTLKRWDGGDW